MEENLEKKPKRPRISAMKANLQENANPSHFETCGTSAFLRQL